MADGSSPRLQRIADYPALLNEAWAQAHAPREANAPTVISTFAGCGGSSLGYHMAGFRELLAVEWEQNAADTFRLNFPHVPLYHGDIAKLSVDECLRLASVAPGELDVFDGSPPCFPAGTMIETEGGPVAIEAVQLGDRVVTHAGRLRSVTEVMARAHVGPLVEVRTKYGRAPVRCTPEHPFYARRRGTERNAAGNPTKTYGAPEWVDAANLRPGDLLLEPHTNDPRPLHCEPVVTKQSINVAGQSGRLGRKIRMGSQPQALDWQTAGMAWVLGFFLAEGHVRGHAPTLTKGGPCRREVVFSVATHEAEMVVSRLAAVGLHGTAQPHSQGSARVSVASPDLWSLCRTMGKGAAGKFIPSAFHAASREWQAAFLDGYFTGDGSARSVGDSTTHRATTVSPHIARGIARMVAAAHRVIASVSTLYPAGSSVICGRAVRVREAYCVSYAEPREGRNRPGAVDELGAWLPVTSVTKTESAAHVVYNFEVEEDHSYVAGGFAVHNCQGFSTAGKREIGDARNQLFREYCRLLEGLRPRAFVMENVSGMVKGDFKIIFAEILRTLKGCGYRVKARLLNAMFYGVPQSRERMIFIGVREDIGREPSHPAGWSAPFGVTPDASPDGVWLTAAQNASAHAHKAEQKQKGRGFGWQEISREKPCTTLPKTYTPTGSCPHWITPRGLRAPSSLELSRIGSFPHAFKFTDRAAQWTRIGNSVPPLLMRSIARHVRTLIA